MLARARRFLRSVYRRAPVFDLGGGFFAIAVTEGSSEIPHIDHHDSKDTMAWIVPVGGWQGDSCVCLPQFDLKIDVRPGEVFAFLASRLLHFTTPPAAGTRLVLTLFTDKFAVKNST